MVQAVSVFVCECPSGNPPTLMMQIYLLVTATYCFWKPVDSIDIVRVDSALCPLAFGKKMKKKKKNMSASFCW